MSELTCFKAYDIRGEIGVNIDADIAYRIGRAVAQNFDAKPVVIGFDARVIRNTQDIVSQKGGIAVQSKTRYARIK